jgi:glycosyltransferase involved in cell wall biosynthesis
MDVTVAICTYNGADEVPDVLDHLRAQEQTDDIQWEVLVVDNNSTDSTESVVRREKERWERDAPLRYAFEGRQGKSHALQTAVEEARGTWVAFLDDDNLPAPGWVATAHQFGQSHPRAGAFGGQIHGQFETEPPKSFGLVKPLFALNERTRTVCYSDGKQLQFAAPGAGLVVRRSAWRESVPETGLELKGPTGDSRGTLGEEFELQWRIYQNGWEVWHNPDMHLDHKIPAGRLEEHYLEDFFRAIGLSRYRTRMMRLEPWQRPFATAVYWGADLWKLVRLGWKYRTKVFTDRFVRGRMWMVLYIFVAPFRSSE